MEIVREQPAAGCTRLRLEGECNIYSAPALKTALLEALHPPGAVELDLSAVTEIDTAGLQVLLAASHMARQTSHGLRLLHPSPAVLELIRIYDLAAWLGDPLVTSADAAIPA